MDFDIAIKLLCDAEVEFVVVGGVSAIFHGASTLTYDLDICYSRTRLNVHRLVEALAPHHPCPRGFPANVPFIWDESTLGNTSLLTLQTDFGEIDLLAEISGLGDYEAVKARSIVVEAYGRRGSHSRP